MFTKTAWITASPKNNHFFLKLFTLEDFAICAMSTSQLNCKFAHINIESVNPVNPKTSYIYPTIYVIKDNMASVIGRKADEKERELILDFYAVNFMQLCVNVVDEHGRFNPLASSNEDFQFIRTLMKNALIKAGLL